jgi:hypothetical protein
VHQLSETATTLLRRAGWFPGRLATDDVIEQWIAQRTFPQETPGLPLVKELNDLQAMFPRPNDPTQSEPCWFEIGLSCGASQHAYLNRIGEALRAKVISFGLIDHAVLLVLAEDGMVYAAFESSLFAVGEDVHDALNGLATGRAFREMTLERRIV